MLDGTNYAWNKDPSKRLFIEASDVGWGCCAFQFATPYVSEDEGVERLLDKSKRRVIEWISKAWTTDQLKLPVFYRESLARLLYEHRQWSNPLHGSHAQRLRQNPQQQGPTQ